MTSTEGESEVADSINEIPRSAIVHPSRPTRPIMDINNKWLFELLLCIIITQSNKTVLRDDYTTSVSVIE